MNITEFEKIFDGCQIIGDKIFVKSNIYKALDFIRKTYGFDMLKEIIATDLTDGKYELTYKLFSVKDNEDALISIIVGDEAESVSKLYDSAIADEKEIYDLF